MTAFFVQSAALVKKPLVLEVLPTQAQLVSEAKRYQVGGVLVLFLAKQCVNSVTWIKGKPVVYRLKSYSKSQWGFSNNRTSRKVNSPLRAFLLTRWVSFPLRASLQIRWANSLLRASLQIRWVNSLLRAFLHKTCLHSKWASSHLKTSNPPMWSVERNRICHNNSEAQLFPAVPCHRRTPPM